MNSAKEQKLVVELISDIMSEAVKSYLFQRELENEKIEISFKITSEGVQDVQCVRTPVRRYRQHEFPFGFPPPPSWWNEGIIYAPWMPLTVVDCRKEAWAEWRPQYEFPFAEELTDHDKLVLLPTSFAMNSDFYQEHTISYAN